MEDRMKCFIFAAAAIGCLSVAIPAQAQPKPQPPCLQIGQVYDFTPVPGNRSLIVTDTFRKKYKVSFMGICRDIQFNLGLGFKAFAPGRLSCLSRGDYVISHSTGSIADRCPIQKIEAYTPQMERSDAEAAAAAKAAKTR